jgi:hypothetical protein
MKFKVNKIAAAVAVSLGTSVVGMSAAQADEILFPYVVTSGTVTTLISTMNNAGTFIGDAAPTELHYRYWYKNGANAESNSATCGEVDRPLPSSANDIVTFDVGGQVKKDNLGILFEDVKVSTLPDGQGRGYGNASFALLAGVAPPVRAFLVVDNNDFASEESFFRTSDSLAGEAIILEFVNGAAWGYAAYNAAGRYNADGVRFNRYDFSDYVETAGEVIASNVAGQGSVPVAIHPRLTATGADDVITKFFVTPIAPSRFSALDGVRVWPGGTYRYSDAGTTRSVVLPTQLRGDLTAAVALSVFDIDLGAAVMYDRDEGPVSGQVIQGVRCVGAVDVRSLLSEGALLQVPAGGWSNLVVGRFAKGANGLPTSGNLTDTDEAVVIKLEYNTATSPSLATVGIVNNAIWLRKGVRESVPTPANTALPRISLFTNGLDINAPAPTEVTLRQ